MVIAVVGSGGKTSRIHALAEQYRKQGKKVLVTTTTHMMVEENSDLSGDAEVILKKLEADRYCMAGLLAAKGKMKALSLQTYEHVCKAADVVLVEADGSKQLPVKVPADHEPVIPENADEIHVVVGLSALGKALKEVSHRKDLVLKCLGVSEDTILLPTHLQKLVQKGYVEPLREKYPAKVIKICPGQINHLYEKAVAQFLREEQDVSVLNPLWFETRPKLVVLGAGHVGTQVARLGKFLDFEVTVIDDRSEFADLEKLPFADHVYCHEFETVEQRFPLESHTYYVVVTRGHFADQLCVEKILNHGAYAYIGMIGSRLKVAKTMEALGEKGFSKELLRNIHAPIGLRIGARTPEEVALSIAAELVQEKNQRSNSTLTKQMLETKESGVLCVITRKTGSSPRGEGSMMLVTEQGILGSIGGGVLEKNVIAYAKNVTGICRETFSLSNEESRNLGMICGGSNEIIFIPINEYL